MYYMKKFSVQNSNTVVAPTDQFTLRILENFENFRYTN